MTAVPIPEAFTAVEAAAPLAEAAEAEVTAAEVIVTVMAMMLSLFSVTWLWSSLASFLHFS